MTSTRPASAALAALLVLGAAAGALSSAGCSSCAKGGTGAGATRGDLAMMPRETNLVVTFNFGRMRGTPLWKKLGELRDESPESKQKYQEIVQRTGLDPLAQFESLLLAFPNSSQGLRGGSFGGVLHGGPFDEAKIAAYMKEEAQKNGSELVVQEAAGKKLYTDKSGQVVLCFLDPRTLLVGGKPWMGKMVELATGKGGESAADNAPLAALIKKTRTGEAFWAAGIVPEEARAKLQEDPRLAAAATMQDAYGSIDVKQGFSLSTTVTLATPEAAKELSSLASTQVADTRKNPQVLMLGMGQFLDAVKSTAEGAAFKLDVKLTQEQVDDLVARLTGLAKTLGGALGGGGGMQLQPPPAPPGN